VLPPTLYDASQRIDAHGRLLKVKNKVTVTAHDSEVCDLCLPPIPIATELLEMVNDAEPVRPPAVALAKVELAAVAPRSIVLLGV